MDLQDFGAIEHTLQKGIEANIITLHKCSGSCHLYTIGPITD
jgi:hypothetical protein